MAADSAAVSAREETMSGAPDYIICLECDSPVYTFEWEDGHIKEAVCPVCGNDDPSQFATESELEELAADERFNRQDP